MLKKADKVMWKTFNSKPFEAVLYCVDLALASSSMNCMISCFMLALRWNVFLLDKSNRQSEFLRGRKVLKLICLFIYELINKFSSPCVQLEAYKAIFSSFDCSARIGLEKYGLKTLSDKIEIEIVTTCACHLLDLAIINPIIYSEPCHSYDLIYETCVSQEMFVKCLTQLRLSSITEDVEIYLKPSVISYYIFEGSLRGWYEPPCNKDESENELIKLNEERFKAASRIDCLLAIVDEKDYDVTHLEEILNWSMIEKDANGWYLERARPLKFNTVKIR